MDMTCSSFISTLAPGTGLLPILQNRVPTLTNILPRPHCHQRLPLQNLVIQTRSPSNLFSRVYPPGFSGLSFRGLPLPTSPTLPFTPRPRGKEQPQWRWLLLPDNFQIRPRITCSQKMPLGQWPPRLCLVPPLFILSLPPFQKPPPRFGSGVPVGIHFPRMGLPPRGQAPLSPSPAPPMTR